MGSSGKRRDLGSIVEDVDFFDGADKDAEYQFFDRELYSSSKKGKSGKKGGKSGGKSGGKRRDLGSIVEDVDFFDGADKDAEYQFFDRELYSSSKKGKSGKSGGKRRDLANDKDAEY